MNKKSEVMKALLPLNPLRADAITFIIIETARTSKCLKLNSFLLFFKKKKVKTNIIKNLIYSENL